MYLSWRDIISWLNLFLFISRIIDAICMHKQPTNDDIAANVQQLRKNSLFFLFISSKSRSLSARLCVIRQTIKFSANIGAHFTANWFQASRFPHIKLSLDMSEYVRERENLNYNTQKIRKCKIFNFFFCSLRFSLPYFFWFSTYFVVTLKNWKTVNILAICRRRQPTTVNGPEHTIAKIATVFSLKFSRKNL